MGLYHVIKVLDSNTHTLFDFRVMPAGPTSMAIFQRQSHKMLADRHIQCCQATITFSSSHPHCGTISVLSDLICYMHHHKDVHLTGNHRLLVTTLDWVQLSHPTLVSALAQHLIALQHCRAAGPCHAQMGTPCCMALRRPKAGLKPGARNQPQLENDIKS